MRRRIAVVSFVALGLAGSAACRGPTEITIEISTDVKCGDVRATSITIGDLSGLDTKPATTVTPACNPGTGRIGSMVIVPSGAKDDVVAIKIVTGLGKEPADCLPPSYGPGCIVARRALRFIPSSSLHVPILMSAVCTGIPCNSTETCVGGNCASATIEDSSKCEAPGGCGEAALGPVVSVDAGAPETGVPDAVLDVPELLLTGISNPIGVYVDSTHVYLADQNSGDIVRVALSAPGVKLPVHATGQAPHAIAVDGGRLYWVDQGKIGLHMNGVVTATAVIGGGRHLTLAGQRVYFSTEAPSILSMDSMLGDLRTHGTGQTGVRGVAANATHVYWATTVNGTIGREAVAGGPGAIVINGEPGAISVAVDDKYVYWTTPTEVRRAEIGVWTPSTLASGQNGATSLVLDRGTLYWTDNMNGAVRSVAAAGGPVVTLATNEPQNMAWPYTQLVAVDAQWVYWASSMNGTLKRVRR